MQKDLTKVKIILKVLGGYFFWNTLYIVVSGMQLKTA